MSIDLQKNTTIDSLLNDILKHIDTYVKSTSSDKLPLLFCSYHFRRNFIDKVAKKLLDDPENEIVFDDEISKAICDGKNLKYLYKCV